MPLLCCSPSKPRPATDYSSGIIQVDTLNLLLQPIREAFEGSEEWRKAAALAYPVEAPPEKKMKVRMIKHGSPHRRHDLI